MQRTTLALLTPKLSATPYLQAQWQYSGGICRHYNWLTDRRRILDAMNTENTADEMFIGAHYLFITIHDGKIIEIEDTNARLDSYTLHTDSVMRSCKVLRTTTMMMMMTRTTQVEMPLLLMKATENVFALHVLIHTCIGIGTLGIALLYVILAS